MRVRHLLYRRGLTCRSQLASAPDWLLLTVPHLGRKALAEIRSIVPLQTDWYKVRSSCASKKRRMVEDADADS